MRLAGLLFGGLALFVVMALGLPIVIEGYAESGQTALVNSFSGGKAFNDAIPTAIYGIAIILFIALIGAGLLTIFTRRR